MKTDLHSLMNLKPTPHRQEGAVLIVALVLLVVLTMLGVSAVESTKLETRMAASTREYNRAFQVAEASLLQALEKYFDNLDSIEFSELSLSLILTDNKGKILGKAYVKITKSATHSYTREDGENIRYYHYFIESTGFSQDDTKIALKVKLVEGMKIKGPAPNNVLIEEDLSASTTSSSGGGSGGLGLE